MTARRYRPWQAAAVALAAFTANAAGQRLVTEPPARPPGTPPDWVFLTGWPLLKLSTSAADLRIANHPDLPDRRLLLRQRTAEWLAFATFSLVGPGTGNPLLILTSTVTQAALTTASVRRVWPNDRRAALLLTPQALWLLYAGALSAYGALTHPAEGRHSQMIFSGRSGRVASRA